MPVTVLTVDVTVTEPPDASVESWLAVRVTMGSCAEDVEEVRRIGLHLFVLHASQRHLGLSVGVHVHDTKARRVARIESGDILSAQVIFDCLKDSGEIVMLMRA